MKLSLIKMSILNSLRAGKTYFIFIIFISIIDGLSFGFVTKATFNLFSYLESSNSQIFDKIFILNLSIFVFSIAFNFFINGFINYLIEINAKKVSGYVNFLLHKKLISKPLIFFDSAHNIERLNLAREGAFVSGYVAMIIIMTFTSTIPAIISMSYYLFTFDIILGFSFLAIIIPNFIIFKYQLLNYENETDALAQVRHRKSYTEKMITSKEFFKETRTLDIVSFLLKKYKKISEDVEDLNINIKKQNLKIDLKVKALNFIFYFLLFGYSIYLLLNQKISIASFGTVFATSGTLIFIIENIFDNDFSVIRAAGAELNALEVLMNETKKQKYEIKITEPPEIEVKNLCFSYPDSEMEVLHNLNFVIPKGKTLAIVGENGSGKTTLSKLLLGLYEPSKGHIMIDGKNTFDNCFLQGVSSLSQNFITYNASLKENIEISDTQKKDDKKIDNLLDYITMNEKKKAINKNTMLGPEFNGIALSKGQEQSLALARSLYPDSYFICLDEPTSALDPEAEAFIISAMKKIVENKTAVVITHRLAMAKKADLILFLKNGKMAEFGDFETLMENRGGFYNLFQSQSKWYV
ncbi:ATP-binding cassette domain-containing protein [Treponema putidum]|uniref:ATP-binding cassette domain-containing protein n=1 Tax=Treponema putidum TaxID=221027 RepID=UPI003D8EB3BB